VDVDDEKIIYYARSIKGKPREEWQTVESHIEGVSKLAEGFLAPYNLSKAGLISALLHDIGKYGDDFIHRLEAAARGEDEFKCDHAVYGAKYLQNHSAFFDTKYDFKDLLFAKQLLQAAILGHHGGLMDMLASDKSPFLDRIEKDLPDYRVVVSRIDKKIKDEIDNNLPFAIKEIIAARKKIDENTNQIEDKNGRIFKKHFFYGLLVKFIYGALIDADRKDARGDKYE
jgi:CRISPR-associated endonuclease Cas3-HD